MQVITTVCFSPAFAVSVHRKVAVKSVIVTASPWLPLLSVSYGITINIQSTSQLDGTTTGAGIV